MLRYFGLLAILLLVGMVLARVLLLRSKGIEAMNFGKLDRKDFLIPPFALFYIYTLFAVAFGLPLGGGEEFFQSELIAWVGVFFSLAGILLFLWALVSFGTSFRVGINPEHPDKLVTTGAFGFSRNPIYVAFALVLIGEFLLFPNWIRLLYLAAGTLLLHRQVLREEDHLKGHYGAEYLAYSKRVRRYL